jgi:uncharacterized Zn-binding protein involved in type VI secretion
MPAVQRLEDANDGGGVLTSTPQDFVTVDNKLVAVVGAMGTSHPPAPDDNTHAAGVWKTAGTSFVRIGGVSVIRTTDVDSCGHTRIGGSSTTRIGDAVGGPNDWDSGNWDEAEWQ